MLSIVEDITVGGQVCLIQIIAQCGKIVADKYNAVNYTKGNW